VSRPRRTDLPETDWATSALCVDMPAEIFDAAGDRVQTAKAACAHCPVTRACLRWALSGVGPAARPWGAPRTCSAGGGVGRAEQVRGGDDAGDGVAVNDG